MFTRVVRSSTVAAAAAFVVVCYLSGGALAQPRVHPSSPAVNQHAPKKPRPVVRLTTRAFGPVTIGTGLTSGERTLRARLGPPTRVTNGGCELSGEKARSLTWGPLNADFSDRNRVGGRLLLVGWRVYPGVSRFTVSLPYKVAVGTPTHPRRSDAFRTPRVASSRSSVYMSSRPRARQESSGSLPRGMALARSR